MSRMAELDMYAYDIEQLYIEGLTEKNIAKTLDISVELVYAWVEMNGVAKEPQPEEEIYSPYFGA
jgi:transposase